MLHLYGKTEALVPYGTTIKELLDRGKYGKPCLDICEENFPLETWEVGLPAAIVVFSIFRVGKPMEFEDMAIALHKSKHRGASLRQGLGFGIEKPHIHERISLILPGSFWRNRKTAFQIRQVPGLYSISGSRHVYLRQLDLVLPEGAFVLATLL